MEADNVAEDMQKTFEELTSFSKQAHWFCPKVDENDFTNYDEADVDDEDVTAAIKRRRVADANRRLKLAYRLKLSYGLDVDDLASIQDVFDQYNEKSEDLLTTCDKCVRNYHMHRKQFRIDIGEDFNEDTVNQLLRMIEELDHKRIEAGIENAVAVLKALSAQKRGMRGLLEADCGQAALQALFEALCCVSYHKPKPQLLCEAMELVQTIKVLRLGYMVPAMARFLFDDNPYLYKFAETGFMKTNQNFTKETFEWIIQDPLIDNMNKVHGGYESAEGVDKFWKGVVLILGRLDESLITHQIRGLDVTPDIYNLAMIHLNTKSEEALKSILDTFVILLRTAPAAFWSAFGATNPSLIVDHVFSSPAYPAVLEHAQIDDLSQAEQSATATAWISMFMEHLKGPIQTNACRSMLNNLLSRFQQESFSAKSRMACLQAGLSSLDITLSQYTARGYEINPTTSFIMINDAMAMVDGFKEIIVAMATLKEGSEGHAELTDAALRVVGRALFLDCSALKAEFVALERGERVDHGLNSHSGTFWKTVMDSFRANDMRLAETVLRGIIPLIGLEEFKPPKTMSLSADKARFNTALTQLTDIVALVFERMGDFTNENLRLLFQNTACAQPLFSGLVSAHSDTRAAAVSLLKTLTDQEERPDAIRMVLDSFMDTFLSAMVVAEKRINLFKTFAAVPIMFKTSGDIVEGLFGTQDGILRSKASLTQKEQAALSDWWTEQWISVKISFQMVEAWSKIHDNELLKKFCRDAMEFADRLFDQYSITAAVLSRQASDGTAARTTSLSKAKADLLEFPSQATSTISNLLRLKDESLVGNAVRLVTKILHRLGDFNLTIDEDTSDRIDQMIHGQVKTIMLNQQKAELRKALEESWGIEEIKPEVIAPKKQGRIDSYYDVGVKSERPSSSASGHGRPVIDVDALPSRPAQPISIADYARASSSTIDAHRSQLDQIKARQKQQKTKFEVGAKPMDKAKAVESLKQSRLREKEEKKARDAAAIADAQAKRNKIVKGEGSGIAGLGGVMGKDHAPVKGTMMVSSDEDESEDDDDGADAMGLIRRVKKPLSDFEIRRRAAAKLPQGPVKKTKIIRSKGDMMARVTPSMTPLHSAILKWDIFHIGDSPPDVNDQRYEKLPKTFSDPEAYKRVMYPLLVAEAWKQLSSERDNTSGEPYDIHVVNRASVDSFMEVSTKMSLADNKKVSIGESDIVILSRGQDPLRDRNASHVMARVHGVKRKRDIVEVVYKVMTSAVSQAPDGLSFSPSTKIRGFKLASITSIEREYAAMSGLSHFDLASEILGAEPSPLQSYNDHILGPIQKFYGLNRGQAAAIWAAKENDAFSLIQGPPGSGKTKTIAALVGALLTDQLKTVQGTAIGRPGGVPHGRQPPQPVLKKLLVCAPSNAAVDELASRLMGGVTDLKGQRQKISVLRLGRTDKINANIADICLDKLVEKRMEGDKASGAIVSENSKLHEQAGKLKSEMAELRLKLEEANGKGQTTDQVRIRRELDERRRAQIRIGQKIDENKDTGNTVARENDLARIKIQKEIIAGAHVICSTLSGAGHDMFKKMDIEFETVIIDEAAQSIEISSLIPLKYGCTKCILVGDPKQLPPTVLSGMGAKFGYEKSLFVRMQENFPDRIHLLDTQYRMHPEISHFPSKSFYDGKLIDGPGLTKIRRQPWHSKQLLGPYQFFDVKGLASRAGTSMVNMVEIDVALQLYARLKSEFPGYDFKNKIGMITPYKGQLKALQAALVRKYGEEILADIDTNTTDAYQGREAEIIIFSCVRANTGGIGFLNDIRRMNVGLTRAKSSMWVLGDSRALEKGEFWNKLLEDARARKRYVDGNVLEMLRKPLAKAIEYNTATDKEVEMEDASVKPSVESVPEPFQEPIPGPPKPKHPVRRPRSSDGPGVKNERQSSSPSAFSASNGVKTENGRPSSLPQKPPTPANDFSTRAGMKLTAGGNVQPASAKRSRPPSPTESGPPKKMQAPNPAPPPIPGLRALGQPKPPSGLAALNAGAPISTLGRNPTLAPKRMAPRKPADPFLSAKPKPKRPS